MLVLGTEPGPLGAASASNTEPSLQPFGKFLNLFEPHFVYKMVTMIVCTFKCVHQVND